jgi:excinuclease ABC subunit B
MQTTRSVRPFEVVSDYTPSGDQPQAIAELAARINAPGPSVTRVPTNRKDNVAVHAALNAAVAAALG